MVSVADHLVVQSKVRRSDCSIVATNFKQFLRVTVLKQEYRTDSKLLDVVIAPLTPEARGCSEELHSKEYNRYRQSDSPCL